MLGDFEEYEMTLKIHSVFPDFSRVATIKMAPLGCLFFAQTSSMPCPSMSFLTLFTSPSISSAPSPLLLPFHVLRARRRHRRVLVSGGERKKWGLFSIADANSAHHRRLLFHFSPSGPGWGRWSAL